MKEGALLGFTGLSQCTAQYSCKTQLTSSPQHQQHHMLTITATQPCSCPLRPPPPPPTHPHTLQVGLNGVDNGAIRFTHVRVPREALLDRFASVERSGRYASPLPSEVGVGWGGVVGWRGVGGCACVCAVCPL